MAISLFNNETEEKNFNNLLAARKLNDQRNERTTYENEIEIAFEVCEKIFKEYGARCNFIAEIDKIERAMESKGILPSSTNKEAIEYEEQIEALTSELTEFLRNNPREVSEELEFRYNQQIMDRRRRSSETLIKEEEVIELYPDSKIADVNQIVVTLKDFFDNIKVYSGEEELEPEIEKKEILAEVIDINLNRQKVIGIKKAPRTLLENANLINQEDYSEELAKPITKTNQELFGTIDDVFSEANTKTIEPEAIPFIKEEIKEDIVEVKIESMPEVSEIELNEPVKEILSEEKIEEVKIEPILEVSEAELNEPIIDVVLEKDIVEENTATIENAEEAITFEMPEDFTLVNLAVALCEDANGWMDIYAANKALFDKVIKEKNNGSTEDIENNKELFASLTINVPTVFNMANEAKKSLTKAA